MLSEIVNGILLTFIIKHVFSVHREVMNFNPVWFTLPLELPNLDLKIQPLALECPTASPL